MGKGVTDWLYSYRQIFLAREIHQTQRVYPELGTFLASIRIGSPFSFYIESSTKFHKDFSKVSKYRRTVSHYLAAPPHSGFRYFNENSSNVFI